MVAYLVKLKYALFILAILFSFYLWENGKQAENSAPAEVEIDSHNSSLPDFKVRNGRVYFYCELTLLNHSDSPQNVKLTAESPEDVRGKLIKNKTLEGFGWGPGFDTISNCNIFTAAANSQPTEVKVVFIGEYDSRNVKFDRNIPNVIKIETINESTGNP